MMYDLDASDIGPLANWEPAWWTEGNVARLRILLCDRAFEAGFEVRNLLDAGRNSPGLADVLHTGDPHRLATLRLLWSLRPRRSYLRIKVPASTALNAERLRSSSKLA